MSNTNRADEINLWMERLIEAWGAVEINCDGYTCVVEDGMGEERYEAATLVEALRLAAADLVVEETEAKSDD